jgi:hypothetical protein
MVPLALVTVAVAKAAAMSVRRVAASVKPTLLPVAVLVPVRYWKVVVVPSVSWSVSPLAAPVRTEALIV